MSTIQSKFLNKLTDVAAMARTTARGWRVEGNIPDSPDADIGERTIKENTVSALEELRQSNNEYFAEHERYRQQVEIEPLRCDEVYTACANDLDEVVRSHATESERLNHELEKIDADIKVESTRLGISREPNTNSLASVHLYALLFVFLEAVITVFTLLQGAASGLQAMGLGVSVSALNVLLGGYVLGGIVMPYTRPLNHPDGSLMHWVFKLIAIAITMTVGVSNTLLGHYRGAGASFEKAWSQFSSNPFAFGDISGLALTGIGLAIFSIWLYKYSHTADENIEYGRLGRERKPLREKIIVNENALFDALRARVDEAKMDLVALADDAIDGVQLAQETLVNSINLVEQSASQEEAIISDFEQITEEYRSQAMQVAQNFAPVYFSDPVDLSDLRSAPRNLTKTEAFVADLKVMKEDLVKRGHEVSREIETLLTSVQEAGKAALKH